MADENKQTEPQPETTTTSGPSDRPKRKFLGIDRDSVKIAVGVLIGVGIVTFIVQNLTDTSITFIWTLTMPRWLLYTVLFGAGVLLGWIIKGLSMRAARRKKSPE